MISIGAVYNGPELQGSDINHLITTVSKIVKEHRGGLKKGTTPWVNAVFVVPGSLSQAGFEGLEFGEYSRKDKGVVVKIAVPVKLVPKKELVDFIVDSLRGANAMAFEFFRQKGEDFPLGEAEALVTKVRNLFAE